MVNYNYICFIIFTSIEDTNNITANIDFGKRLKRPTKDLPNKIPKINLPVPKIITAVSLRAPNLY